MIEHQQAADGPQLSNPGVGLTRPRASATFTTTSATPDTVVSRDPATIIRNLVDSGGRS